jgi:hypothetical protein
MDPLDAVVLDNWFPDGAGITVRNGYARHTGGLGASPVETLAEFHAGAIRQLIAACDGSIWNTSDGLLVHIAVGSGFNSNRWQTVTFLSRLFLVNGVDTAQVWNGVTLAASTFTGVALNTLVGVWQYQQRLFFWQNNSTGFWYAPLNSITGALAFFDLGAFAPHGGNLITMTTISYDGGNGVQDYAVFIMSSGDTLVYQGNDPSLLSGWALVGEFHTAAPVSARSVTNYGGEAFLTTYDDHMTFQQMFTALRKGEMPSRSKVSRAVQLAVQENRDMFGWQAIYYARGRSLIFNIPNKNGSFHQHVCNTAAKGQPWCRYTGMNASCWAVFNDLLYFGGSGGTIWQADTGNLDNLGTIPAYAQQAWNRFKNAQRKRVTAVRPMVQSVIGVNYAFGLGFDYASPTISVPARTPVVGPAWDETDWDESLWTPEVGIVSSWRVGGGTGTSISFILSVQASQPISWFRTDLRIEGGNAL